MIRAASQTRRADDPTPSVREPSYFVTTGFPRSGNTWFETMLSDAPGVGGFSPDARVGVPLTLQMIRRHSRLVRLLETHDMPLQNAVRRLLNPDDAPGSALPESVRPSVTRLMADEILPDARRVRHYFDESRSARQLSLDRLIEPLFASESNTRDSATPIFAFGLPSKHIPVSELRHATPDFRIIRIVRDPRDVLVSKFYHDLGKLRGDLIERFVSLGEGGRVQLREDWRKAYFEPLRDRMVTYFAGDEEPDIEVRYESLLVDPSAEMARVVSELGGRTDAEEMARIADRYRFDRLDGSGAERRNSFIRRGVSGDWRGYFDRSLVRALGDEFVDLVTSLGYEANGDWSRAAPETASRSFEFSRFRIRRSATAEFQSIWMSDSDLQDRYANPFETRDDRGDSFYHWLRRCDRVDVAEWFRVADELVELWKVDIDENAFH
ncbi:MAG: sulfotransferase domain-containing protein [Phycisphaerales bacterium]